MSADQAFVAEQIAKGLYTLSHHHKGKSFIWNVLSEILKEDKTIVEGLVFCRTCRKVLKYLNSQTSNLSRHKCCENFKQPQNLKRVMAEDKQNCIDACTAWVVEDCHPFSSINGSGFLKVVEFLVKMGATYGKNLDLKDLLPDPTTISRKLQNSAEETRNKLKDEISDAINSGGASATVNFWTDNYVKRNFLGVTLHYQKDSHLLDIVLGLKSMDFERSTGDNILSKIHSLFGQFDVENIEKIVFITDRGKNIVKALEHCTRLNCSSHLLANVLDKSFEETTELSQMFESCKKIVKYFKKANLQHMPPTSLKSECPTWWNSHYTMLKSIVDNWFHMNEILDENKGKQILLHINISTVEIIVHLCRDFEVIFKKMQLCNSPSLCYVLPSIQKIKSLCLPNSADISAISVLKENIVRNIDDIWVNKLSLWHKVAFFLYPPAAGMQQSDINNIKSFCVSRIHWLENNAAFSTITSASTLRFMPVSYNVSSQVTSESTNSHTLSFASSGSLSRTSNCSVTTFVSPSPSSKQDIQFFFADLLRESALSPAETPKEEVDRYSREIVKITEDFNLIGWWIINAENYPRLSKVARQIHSIPASSAAAERVFSLAGNIIIEKRNRLGPKTVDNLLFLNSYHKKYNKKL